MSDTVKAYHEAVKNGKIDPDESYEDRREKEIIQLLTRAAKSGKLNEIEHRAIEVQKEFGSTSFKLGLQIAVQEILGDS